MAVSKSTRYEVLRRDNHACRYCGARAPDAPMTVDHVIPTALGGSNDPSNLVAACRDCNQGKASTPPDAPLVDDVAQDALRWARAMQAAAKAQALKAGERADYIEAFDLTWWSWLFDQDRGWDGRPLPAGYLGTNGVPGERAPLPDGWRDSIARFFDLRLEEEWVEHYVDVALTKASVRPNDKFKYFCGCMWRHLAERQEIAREMVVLEEGEG